MRFRLLLATSTALVLFSATAARPAPVNFGPQRPVVEGESVIPPHALGGPPSVLYCPAETDQPGFRADIAAWTGGVCDYIDPRVNLPSLAFLQTYDVVFTFPNFGFADPVAWGNRLADYVDGGGRVVLGAFSTYTSGNSIGGRIMGPDYCPVRSPSGTNHFAFSNYGGLGTSYIHRDVGFYTDTIRDFLVLQGQGILDGRWNDGEIAVAYRGDGRVMYFNGVGPAIGGAGDQERLIGNFAKWVQPGGVLYGCDDTGHLFALNLRTGKGSLVGALPIAAVSEIDFSDATGAAYAQSAVASSLAPFAIGNGAAAGAPVGQAARFDGVEAIGGNWFGCASAFPCATADIFLFNPATGAVTSGPLTTGVGPIAGMAWNTPLLRMFYVTDPSGGCVPNSTLYWNATFGDPLNSLGPVGFAAGSLEWGPDDNLYGGSIGGPGVLYRINPTTGVSSVIGPTGFGPMTGLALVNGPNTVGVGSFAGSAAPPALALTSIRPNPSRVGAGVVLSFSLAQAGHAHLEVYDVNGRHVWTSEEVAFSAGDHALGWNGHDARHVRAPAGIYFVRVVSDEGTREGKLLRL
jgi:hypothetical protein